MKKTYNIPTIKVAYISQALLLSVSDNTEADPEKPSLSKFYDYEWDGEDPQ